MDEGKKRVNWEENFSRPRCDDFGKTFRRLFHYQHLTLQRFPYDFRGEEIMSLVKHIVARCESKSRLADSMSEILSALLIRLTTLSRHEEDMKANKKPLDEVSQVALICRSHLNSRF